jgi:hypothetical protein
MQKRSALMCKSSISVPALAALVLAGASGMANADSFMLAPDNPAELARAAAPVLSAAEKNALIERMQARREARAATAVAAPAGAVDAATEAGVARVAPTMIGGSRGVELPDTVTIGRNLKNIRAEDAANSTLAEPAAVNNRNQVLYTGNFAHAERSINHGLTYTSFAIPAGPADAPIQCCDNDVAYDEFTNTAFHSHLYINSALTNGVVRIFVKNPLNLSLTKCSYTIDPGGTANNILPDYPHIAVSNTKVYLTINADSTTGTDFARIYRFDETQMRNCQTTSTQTFTQNQGAIGQRVWVPANGGDLRTNMMWVQNESSTSMRVFNWNQVDAAPTSIVRNVASSVFANPDCRGGIGNFDFIERSTATGIAGFRTRCTMASGVDQPTPVLACYNHSAPNGAARPHAYLRGTVFRISDRVLISQPDIFNNVHCWGYPAMSSNSRGNIGMAVAFGGRTGGGGNAVRGAVGIKKSAAAVGSFITTASGVANRSDGRYGDYTTTERYHTCTAWFGATTYAWDSSPVDAANDVNARWTEFGREGDLACYNAAQ